jgi:YD repeat-containing protein
MMSLNRVSVVFLSLLTICTYAQDLQLPINIQSPNAGGLGKYGDVPVSLYTGSPNINIPLFDTNIKGMGLNLTLNYDASGVRPDDHPGWVGQNWSLDAGGVITRTVQGYPDEDIGTATKQNTGDESIITGEGNPIIIRVSYFSEVLRFRDVDNYDLKNSKSLRQLAFDRANIKFSYPVDFEPDIFTFNFMGISGKFFMGMDGQWKVSSATNLEIVFDPSDLKNYTKPFIENIPNPFYATPYNHVIFGFKIRDDKGNIYTFGYDQDAIEYSIPFWSQIYYSPYQGVQAGNSAVGVTQWMANSWHITSVVDRYGNKIYEFKYARDTYISSFAKTYQASAKSCSTPSGPVFNEHHSLTTPMASQSATDVTGSLISPIYLTNITSIQGHVISFNRSPSTELEYSWDGSFSSTSQPLQDIHANGEYNTAVFQPFYFIQTNSQYSPNFSEAINNPLKGLRWMELNTITISKPDGAGQLKLLRVIDLLHNNNSNERLNLTGVTIRGSSLANKYSYTFHYDQFNQLPRYLSERLDHWGYYRGGSPSPLYLDDRYYSGRTPNSDFLSIGLLKSIIYPTGGSTSFQFEPHDYAKIVKDGKDGFLQESGIAGGVRIKSITDFDGVNSINKNYKYIINFMDGGSSSSGILSFKPIYFWPNWTVKTTADYDFTQSVFSTNTLVPLGNWFGSHIGYSEVTEVRSDGATTVNKFTGNEDFMDELPAADCNVGLSPYKKFNDRSFMRGKLKEKLEYDADGQLKRKIVNNYQGIGDLSGSYTVVTNANGGYNCEKNVQQYFLGQAWKIYWLDFELVEEETTTYFPNRALIENVKYTKEEEIDVYQYDSPFSLTLTKSISKTIAGDRFNTRFNYALDLASGDNSATLLKNSRVFGEVMETIQTKNDNYIGAGKTNYQLENTLCVPDSKVVSSTDPENYYTQLSYDKYDNTGNLLQYTTISGISTAIIWSYKNQLPVAEIIGATYDQVMDAFGRANIFVESINFGFGYPSDDVFRSQFESLRMALPGIQIKFYTYGLFGVSSISDPNGSTTYYEYDDLGRLKIIRNTDKEIVKSYTYNFK